MNEAAVGENYVRRTLSSGTTYLLYPGRYVEDGEG